MGGALFAVLLLVAVGAVLLARGRDGGVDDRTPPGPSAPAPAASNAPPPPEAPRTAAAAPAPASSGHAAPLRLVPATTSSEDASAPQGGDLGWASAGAYVPEFEEALATLDVGGISEPVVTRFGVHLIQVVDRRQVTLDVKQQREQARNILREQKFEEAYAEWLRDLRGRAYIEMREPPQ